MTYIGLAARLFALFASFSFGFFAQAPFLVIKQSTLLVKGDSTAVQAVSGQPAFFDGKQVQGGNTTKYRQKNKYIHSPSAALSAPGVERCRTIGCCPGGSGAVCVQV